MFFIIYMVLLALSDVTVPAMTVQVLTGKNICISKVTYLFLFFLMILCRCLIVINYIYFDIFIYLIFLYIVAKKNHAFHAFGYHIGLFVIANILIIPIINFIYRYFFDGFMSYDFVFSDILPNTNLEFIRKMLFLVFLLFIKNWKIKEKKLIKTKYWHILYVFSVLCFFSIILLTVFSMKNDNQSIYALSSTLAGIMVVLFYLFNSFFISLYDNLIKNQEISLENEKTKIKLNSLLEIQHNIEEVRKFRHDIKNNFIVLQHLLEKEEITRANTFLEKYIKDFKLSSQGLQIDNLVVNAIINYKVRMYTSLLFDVKCLIPDDILIEDVDLAIIIGNLIDNSCEYLKLAQFHETVYIKMLIHMNNVLFIEIKNVLANGIIEKSVVEKSKSDEFHHGYGLINVQNVVHRYKGTYDVKIEDGFYITTILIPNMLM